MFELGCKFSFFPKMSEFETQQAVNTADAQLFRTWKRGLDLFIISLLDMLLLFQLFHIFTLEYDTSFQSFNTFTVCPSFTCSQCCVSAQLWKWRLFESLCVHSGFPSVCTREGGSTSIHLFTPFYVAVWAPNIGGSGYFTLLLSDYLLFSFLWCSYIWAWSAVNATERLMFALVRLYLYKGRGWRCLSGFWVFFVLFSSLRPISSEIYSTITCSHCTRPPIIKNI